MAEISIVMPAYRAEGTIVLSVASVLLQSYQDWELLIVADDNADYEQVLGRAGIYDSRIRHLTTSTVCSGSPKARNVGLDAARFRYSAILDADDYMHPEKLTRAMSKVRHYPLVSCALRLVSHDRRLLRTVGVGKDRLLRSDQYKFTNYSSDSMLVYDRQHADPRFDPELTCATDVDFLLRLFAHTDACYHLGTPLHWYVKQPVSVTNGSGASERLIRSKKLLQTRLAHGHYPLKDPHAREHFEFFYECSLTAEAEFGLARFSNPHALFEDFMEAALQRGRMGLERAVA